MYIYTITDIVLAYCLLNDIPRILYISSVEVVRKSIIRIESNTHG